MMGILAPAARRPGDRRMVGRLSVFPIGRLWAMPAVVDTSGPNLIIQLQLGGLQFANRETEHGRRRIRRQQF